MSDLCQLYVAKRLIVAVDEWLFYLALVYLYRARFPRWIIALTFVYGALALVTGYKNLNVIERRLHISRWLLYPLLRDGATPARRGTKK